MKLTPMNRIYSVPGVWTIAGGTLGLAVAYLAVIMLQPFIPALVDQIVLYSIFGVAVLIGLIAGLSACVKGSDAILHQLQMKIRGVYGFTVSLETLGKLLPISDRSGWTNGSERYGSFTMELPIGKETRTLVRKGDIFHFETKLAQEEIVHKLEDIREVKSLDAWL